MLKELELACDPSFSAMLRSPWRDSTIVSSESAYVVQLVAAINNVADVVKTEVEHRKYFRSFCDKAVGSALDRLAVLVAWLMSTTGSYWHASRRRSYVRDQYHQSGQNR